MKAQLWRVIVIFLVAGVGLHLLTDTSVPTALGVFDGIALSLLILVACISTPRPAFACGLTAVALYSAHLLLGPLTSGPALEKAGVTYGLALAILRQDAGFPVLAWAPFALAGYLCARWLWLGGSGVVKPALSARKRIELGAISCTALAACLGLWVATTAPDKWTTNPSYFALGIGWIAVNTLVADQVTRMGFDKAIVVLTTLGNWSLVLLGVNWFLFQSLPTVLGVTQPESLVLSIASMIVGVVSGIAIAWGMQHADWWIRGLDGAVRTLALAALMSAIVGIVLLLGGHKSGVWYLTGLILSLLSPYALRPSVSAHSGQSRSPIPREVNQ